MLSFDVIAPPSVVHDASVIEIEGPSIPGLSAETEILRSELCDQRALRTRSSREKLSLILDELQMLKTAVNRQHSALTKLCKTDHVRDSYQGSVFDASLCESPDYAPLATCGMPSMAPAATLSVGALEPSISSLPSTIHVPQPQPSVTDASTVTEAEEGPKRKKKKRKRPIDKMSAEMRRRYGPRSSFHKKPSGVEAAALRSTHAEVFGRAENSRLRWQLLQERARLHGTLTPTTTAEAMKSSRPRIKPTRVQDC